MQMACLERELERGPLAHGWIDQGWTLARVKTMIGRLFHVSCTMEGTWRLLRRYGWSWQAGCEGSDSRTRWPGYG